MSRPIPMLDSVLLLVYAAAAATWGASLLAARPWFARVPRVAIAVWLAAVCSVLLSVALASLLLALDSFSVRQSLTDLIRACVMSFHRHYSDLPASALVGLGLLVTATSWLGSHSMVYIVRTRRARKRHRDMLTILGAPTTNASVTMVEHPSSNVYCLPGEGGRIVVTTKAARALTPEQLAAVIAHERAHLRGRHHLLTGISSCLCTALPRVPLMRQAREAISFLVERTADERACRSFPRNTLVTAMLAVGNAAPPGVALGAGGHSVIQRATLLTAGRSGSRRHVAVGLLLATGLLFAPVGLVVSPVVGLDWHDHCLVTPET